jgi:hypothetical protein
MRSLRLAQALEEPHALVHDTVQSLKGHRGQEAAALDEHGEGATDVRQRYRIEL